MAEDQNGDAGNRATIAQTLAEVRGLRDFADARFTDVQRQLDAVAGLPGAVVALQRDLKALDAREAESDGDFDRRLVSLETGNRDRSDYWRKHFPIIALTFVLAMAAIITLVIQLNS